MAGRSSVRRSAGHERPAGRPSLLMLDYLETGLFRGRPDGVPGQAAETGRSGTAGRRRRSHGLGASVRRVTADRRVLAVAAIVAATLAVLAGIYLPLHSTQASRSPAPPIPQAPASSAALPPATPQDTSPPASRPVQASPGQASPGHQDPGTAHSPQARPAAGTGTAAGVGPVPSAAARASRAASAVVVRFTVSSPEAGIFRGQVQIVNEGTQPLASWQVSVALPGDRVVAVSNASGLVVNGILLLEPASGALPVPAGGGVLDVVFVAVGTPPVSGTCTFNQVSCR